VRGQGKEKGTGVSFVGFFFPLSEPPDFCMENNKMKYKLLQKGYSDTEISIRLVTGQLSL